MSQKSHFSLKTLLAWICAVALGVALFAGVTYLTNLFPGLDLPVAVLIFALLILVVLKEL